MQAAAAVQQIWHEFPALGTAGDSFRQLQHVCLWQSVFPAQRLQFASSYSIITFSMAHPLLRLLCYDYIVTLVCRALLAASDLLLCMLQSPC
jgi:hypothetical protein